MKSISCLTQLLSYTGATQQLLKQWHRFTICHNACVGGQWQILPSFLFPNFLQPFFSFPTSPTYKPLTNTWTRKCDNNDALQLEAIPTSCHAFSFPIPLVLLLLKNTADICIMKQYSVQYNGPLWMACSIQIDPWGTTPVLCIKWDKTLINGKVNVDLYSASL